MFYKSKFTFIFVNWSCTSSWQDLERLRKYYRLEVQLPHLVDFAQFLLQFALNLTFWHSIQSYILSGFENTTGQRYFVHLRRILARFIYFLINKKKNFFTFHVCRTPLWSHSIIIFLYYAVLFVWLVGSWITKKTM